MSTTRARVCDTCLSCPSTIFCKADVAYLCATCDAVIHSANPLAGRHHRVPVMLMSGLNYGHQAADSRSITGPGVESQGGFLSQGSRDVVDDEEEDEAASWLLFDNQNQNDETNGFLFNGDEYLDLVVHNSCVDDDHRCNDLLFDNRYMNGCDNIRQQSYGGGDADGIVPVQPGEAKQHLKLEWGMEYETSNGGYGCPSAQLPAVIDRKVKVLRYMEKKKRRKFEKTIRYASRKAYAEKRPRIKGRFAKRKSGGVEVEQMFSTTLTTEDGYCIVPSF